MVSEKKSEFEIARGYSVKKSLREPCSDINP